MLQGGAGASFLHTGFTEGMVDESPPGLMTHQLQSISPAPGRKRSPQFPSCLPPPQCFCQARYLTERDHSAQPPQQPATTMPDHYTAQPPQCPVTTLLSRHSTQPPWHPVTMLQFAGRSAERERDPAQGAIACPCPVQGGLARNK